MLARILRKIKRFILLSGLFVIVFGLIALSLIDNSRLAVTGTCTIGDELVNLAGHEVRVLSEDAGSLVGVLSLKGVQVSCAKEQISYRSVPYLGGISIFGKTKPSNETLKTQLKDKELEVYKELEKKTLLLRGKCLDGVGERLISVFSVKRESKEIVFHGLDIATNKEITCLEGSSSYQQVDEVYIRDFKVRNRIDVEGEIVLVSGVCESAKGDVFELVSAKAQVIHMEEGRMSAGLEDQSTVVICDEKKTGKFQLRAYSKRSK